MQGFEVAFRHQTFTGAAHELGVSQGAVSRQVQELERWLGVELFIRSGPHLRLTTTGKALGDQSVVPWTSSKKPLIVPRRSMVHDL
jgi:DNA-binding transcriptional LysR family regulator